MANASDNLVLFLEARLDRFEQNLNKGALLLDQRIAQMEKRASLGEKRMGDSWKRFGSVAAGALSMVAIDSFVDRAMTRVDGIKRQSQVWGTMTDTTQAWAIVAEKAETPLEALDTGMTKFSAALGEARAGGGEFKKILDQLLGAGTYKTGSIEEIFYRFIDAANHLETSQRDTTLKGGLGKGFAGMSGFVALGSAEIRKQSEELKRNGAILQNDVLGKVDNLGDSWRDVKAQLDVAGINVLSGFADAIHKMTGDFKDEKFQTALKSFGGFMGQLATFMAKYADKLPLLAGAFLGAKIPGPPMIKAGGAALGALLAYHKMNETDPSLTELVKRADVARSEANDLKAYWGGPGKAVDLYGEGALRAKEAGNRATEAEAAVAARKAAIAAAAWAGAHPNSAGGKVTGLHGLDLGAPDKRDAAKKALDDALEAGRAQLGKLGSQSDAPGMAAGKQANVLFVEEQLEGIYKKVSKAALEKGASEEVAAKQSHVAVEAARSQIEALGKLIEVATDAKAHVVFDEESKRQFEAAVARYQEQAVAIGKTAGHVAEYEYVQNALNAAMERHITLTQAEIEAIRAQGAAVGEAAQRSADSIEITQRQIEATDALRNGVERMAESGLHGFNNLKSAGADLLDQMGMMILRAKTLEPLMNWALGKKGEAGGGVLGGVIGDMFGPGSKSAMGPEDVAVTGVRGALSGSSGGIGGFLQYIWDAIPGFDSGVNYHPGGLGYVHHDELIKFPRGSKVYSKAATPGALRQFAAGSARGGMIVDGRSSITIEGNADNSAIQMAADMLAEHRRQLPTIIRTINLQDRANFAGVYGG